MQNPDTLNEFALRRNWGPSFRCPKVLEYQPPASKQNAFTVIAGPCSVESIDQIHEAAETAETFGATHLRGGVYRAGTYPGSNFGYIQQELIAAFKDAANSNGLKNIIEVLDYSNESLPMIAAFADCFQVGCRQMQNYKLLRMLGSFGKPVFLKRHPGSTLNEWLGSAEHLLTGGVTELYLIERGSSTHMDHTRWDLSISMIPAVQAITQIPIIVDGSHGTGRRDLVEPMTLAGVAAGANGLLVEIHKDPANSLSDPDQAISYGSFKKLMGKVNAVRNAVKGCYDELS